MMLRVKPPRFGFRGTLALLLVAALAITGGLLWWWQTAQEREIERLRKAIEHLTASYPIARLVVVAQQELPDGLTRTTVRVWFIDEQGRRRGEPQEASLAGRRVYFEALLVVFQDPLVEAGQRRAMAFPTRLFTEEVPPSDGTLLDLLDERGVPLPYDRPDSPPGGLALSEYREILRRFWELANHPAAATRYGIQVLQGQAVFTEYQIGRYYSIHVEADGGLTIRPELLWLE
jgi:hypothetical protein